MSHSGVVIVIPARYGSSRLPGKPLLDIAGCPMIVHVYRRARAVPGVERVVVATDDERIKACVEGVGGEAFMTSAAHPSGTDRVSEAARMMGLPEDAVVVNVQGDQPLLDPGIVTPMVGALLEDPSLPMATLACPMDPGQARDPNRVKVVLGKGGFALYFSRSRIPFDRDGTWEQPGCYLRHLGLYAYRNGFLQEFVSLPLGMLERIERLEQLRALENGFPIKVMVVKEAPVEVDTPGDLERVQAVMDAGA